MSHAIRVELIDFRYAMTRARPDGALVHPFSRFLNWLTSFRENRKYQIVADCYEKSKTHAYNLG